MAIPDTFGERVRLARDRAGLDQATLAKELGVHAKTISKWENDRQTPTRGMLQALAKALHTEAAILAYGVTQEELMRAWELRGERNQDLEDDANDAERSRRTRSEYLGGQPRREPPNKVLAYVHRFVADLAERGASERQLGAARRLLTGSDTVVYLSGENADRLSEPDWLELVRRMADGLRVAARLPRTEAADY